MIAAALGVACGSSKVVPLQKPADGGSNATEVMIPAAPVDAAIVLPPGDGPAAAPSEVTGELSCGAPMMKNMPGNAGCKFFVAEPLMTGAAGCYALVVVNPGTRRAKLNLERAGETFVLDQVARLPRGSGERLTYEPFDNAAGLAPGEVAILFLAGQGTGPGTGPNDNGCPLGTTGAVPSTTNKVRTSHIGQSFQLTSDQPVVAYDINPFGGVYSYLSSASLLIPVESWSGNYVAAVPPHAVPTLVGKSGGMYDTFVMIVASEDDTEVTVRAPVPTAGGTGVPATAAGRTLRLRLNAGQFAQVMETNAVPATPPGMSGTLISANKPVGVIGGSPCLFLPVGATACDAAHQQIPPLSSWGHEYAAIPHRTRLASLKEESVPWQIVAAVDGTVLSYLPRTPTANAPPAAMNTVPPPTTLAAGQTVQFWTDEPFVVRSQDAAHPIHISGMMTGGHFMQLERQGSGRSSGDPEFVNTIPTDQFKTDVTFFTDPTYPETTLVVVRKPGADGRFADVKLGCTTTPIGGWSALGSLEFTRVDLVKSRHQPVIPGCDNGVHRMTSTAPFSITVWGTGPVVSYAYPGGTALRPINDVVVVP